MLFSQSCIDPKFVAMAPGRGSAMHRTTLCLLSIVVAMVSIAFLQVEAAPFPAPKLSDCESSEQCCPTPSKVAPIPFTLPTGATSTRRAANLVDAAYIAKYRRAYKLMKALPASDPRSLTAQAKMHCAYCGSAFTYPGKSSWGLEIHEGWFFFAWHRMFLYFHERILASLINDPTFALPFWNWDNQSSKGPRANWPNVMPNFYANPTYNNGRTVNPVYNRNRNACARPPNIIDLNSGGGCSNTPDRILQTENNRLMYNQMATATTPSLFFGSSYRLGQSGARGGGNLEGAPHGTVHVFTGDPNARSPRNPFDDMGNLDRAALDPLFYSHHANIDRLWEVWKAGGGRRVDIRDADYTRSQFVFYNEKKQLVSISVGQVLRLSNLKYNYQNVPNPWASPSANTLGVMSGDNSVSGSSVQTHKCAPPNQNPGKVISKSQVLSKFGTEFSTKSLTFRVRRVHPSDKREEVLVFKDLQVDWTKTAMIHAFLFYPDASGSSIRDCMEFFGTFSHIPEANHRQKKSYTRNWKLGLTAKLAQLELPNISHVVVTLVQVKGSSQKIKFSSVGIVFDDN